MSTALTSRPPQRLNAAELAKELSYNPAARILDVSTPAEFRQEHLPSAINLPFDSVKTSRLIHDPAFAKEEPLYLTCRTGRRSAAALEKFQKAGFLTLFVLDGGTQSWSKAGLPTIQGERKTLSLERQTRIGIGVLILIGSFLGFTVNIGFFAITTFFGAGLIFAGITDWCGLALLLARAPWNR